MLRSEPCKDNPSVNIVTRCGVATSEDKAEGKQPILDTWVRRPCEKNFGFDIQRENEAFMEARKRFMDPSAYTSKT